MAIFIIILSCLLWVGALVTLPGRQLLSVALSYVGLMTLSFARGPEGFPMVPVNNTILTSWFCISLVTMFIILLQPVAVRTQARGMGYMIIGALTGMAVGLLAHSVTTAAATLYAIMIIATVIGTFLGFLLYTNTPDGRPVAIKSGNFFRYLLAKGFPTAITVMQIGVALVIIIVNN